MPISPAHERYSTLPKVVREELKAAAAEVAVLPYDLLRPNQQQHVVAARVRVFRFLRARGYSYPAIARVFGMHHTTVVYSLQRHTKAPKPAAVKEPVPFPDYSGEWAI